MLLSGTETQKNLAVAFANECRAVARYTLFAEVAKKQGFDKIAEFFLETAQNEKAHSKIFYSELKSSGMEPLQVSTDVSTNGIQTTLDNLRAATEAEFMESTQVYPHYAETAEKEGFPNLARLFQAIGSVEKSHHERFMKLANDVSNHSVSKRKVKMEWKCRNCGYIYIGLAAPRACPLCHAPYSSFEIKEKLE